MRMRVGGEDQTDHLSRFGLDEEKERRVTDEGQTRDATERIRGRKER